MTKRRKKACFYEDDFDVLRRRILGHRFFGSGKPDNPTSVGSAIGHLTSTSSKSIGQSVSRIARIVHPRQELPGARAVAVQDSYKRGTQALVSLRAKCGGSIIYRRA